MATLTIRKLDDEVYERLRAQARRNDRSIKAEARQLLGDRLHRRSDWVGELAAFHSEMVAKHGHLPDSLPLIREMRDAD